MNKWRKGILYLIAVCTLYACGGDDFTLGNYLVESHSRSIVTDTLTVTVTEVKMDSIQTSGLGSGFIGLYNDPLTGSFISSVAFDVPMPTISIDEDAIFDSIVVVLRHSGIYYGDTLKTMNLSVYRLKEQLYPDDNDYFYNSSSYEKESIPIANFSYKPQPSDLSDFTIRLPDEIGIDLMRKIITEDTKVTNEDNFKEYFKGFAIECTDESSVIGYTVSDSSLLIQLDYHVASEINIEKNFQMPGSGRHYFTKMNSYYAQTAFKGLDISNEINSSESENMFFIQMDNGIYSRIEFPNLNNLLEQGQFMSINSAYMYIYPLKDSYGGQTPLPETLYAYITNELDLQEYNSEGNASAITGTLYEDDMYDRNTYYVFDVSDFLSEELGKVGINKRKLLLTSGATTTLRRAVFGDSHHETNPLKLVVQYSFYNE